MKPKIKLKMYVDFLMSIFLLCLMAYQIVGEYLHEWFGVGMLILFVLHTVLNVKWYKNLFKGRYTVLRAVNTVINFAVLISILCLGYSGIVLSRHLFAFLPIDGGMALARVMHLAASYWGFLLMSFHLGLHFGMVTGIAKKMFNIPDANIVVTILSKTAVICISAYGMYSFLVERIADNLFLKTQFVFFDYDASAFTIFGRYIAIMALFAATAYYLVKLIQIISENAKESVLS